MLSLQLPLETPFVDPLSTLPTSFRFQTHLGDRQPFGMWKDVACTQPARSSGDAVLGLTDLAGNIIATQSDPTKAFTLQWLNGSPVLHMDANQFMLTSVSVTNPYSIAVAETPLDGGSGRRTVNANAGNSCLSLGRLIDQVFVQGDIYSSPSWLGKGVGILSVGTQSTFFFNGQNITQNAGVLNDWGPLALGAAPAAAEGGYTYLTAVIAIPSVLTGPQLAAVQAYLASLLP